eukprot:SAG31_NODE_3181_length_4582_cov_2.306268_3_plen_57_part_00
MLRGLQEYDERTREAEFVYAAEHGAEQQQRDWGSKLQYYTGMSVMTGATDGEFLFH